MPPQTSSTGSLDPQVVALSQAIRQTESGGDPKAKGASGEYGAYQFEPGTWSTYAKEAGVNVPLEQSTLQQQNQVAYTKIKKWKDEGYNPGQIASMWNAGMGEPNAYTGKFSNGQPSTGVNPEGVHFDVPGYATKVAQNYQKYKGGGAPGAAEQPQSSPETTSAPKSSLLDKVQKVLTTIFPGTEQIGESIGTAAANIGLLAQGKNPNLPVNIPKTIGGYLEAGSTVGAPGVSAPTAIGRIGTTAGLGALAGAGGALASGSTSAGQIAKQGLLGGAVGGAVGGAAELISKAANYLPYRLARTYLPGTSEETANYAVEKGLGTPTSMLNKSDASLNQIGKGIESVLSDPSLENVTATAPDVYQGILEKYPNAGLTMDTVGEELKKLAPLQSSLVDKLESEGLSAKELNQLKTAIGSATYKTVFDDPAVKAGKQIGNAAYSAISGWLENKVPDAVPLFDEYSKELQLNGALQKAIRSAAKARPLTLRDIIALVSGTTAFGPLGGIGTYVAEKAATNPSVNLVTGGLINKLSGPGVGALTRTAGISGIGNFSSQGK